VRRREFITLFGGAAAWPLGARAQQSARPVIGFLSGTTFDAMRDNIAGFHRGLAETGYVADRNVTIEYRWAEDHYDRLPVLAADLIRRQVNTIVVGGSTPGALAAKAATQTIPIVFLVGPDPVKTGLVASLARPGGNLTGVTIINVELIAKCLGVLHELVPTATTIAVLVNPANPLQTETETRDVQAAAPILGVRVVILHASSPTEIESAFATLIGERAGGLVISGEAFRVSSQMRCSSMTICSRVSASSAPNGSSISKSGGSWMSARQIETRWRIPPDSSCGYLSSKPASPVIVKSARAFSS
jgi:putative tryptophan/tyrosine transport system substrate-binding protein